jgi:polysaccharide biosynthesis protein PslH
MFKIRKHPVFKKFHHRFKGRVDELSEFYHAARLVLLPVIEVHGIAIKTIDAISFGKTIVATPLAFPGFERHLPDNMRFEIASNWEDFRTRMLKEITAETPRKDPCAIKLYEKLFTIERQTEAYKKIVLGV